MRINIAGLPKEKIIIALFNNVYRKSKASRQTWMSIADHVYYGGSKAPVGTDRAPTEQEVGAVLTARKGRVDYIGAVAFKMDFSTDEIDVTFYDQEHCTGSGSIKTAEACVASVKAECEALVAEKAREAASIDLVTKALKKHLCVEHLKVSCSEYASDTQVSVGANYPTIDFSLAGKVSAIAEKLSGSESTACLDRAKAQYEALVAEKAREAASIDLVTKALKKHLGVTHLKVSCYKYISNITVSVGASYSTIDFSLPGEIPAIAEILSGPKSTEYLDKAKAQYEALAAKKAQRVIIKSNNKEDFLNALDSKLKEPGFKRADILDLFAQIKKRDGAYSYIHQQRNPKRDGKLIFFKSSVLGQNESNVWHTATYQKAVKLLKEAYVAKGVEDQSDKERQSEANAFIDYVRGNSPVHFSETSTRLLLK